MPVKDNFLQTVNDLAIEAAKISFSRDEQNKETDPAKIAQVLFSKYTAAYSQLNDMAQTLRKE